MDRIELRRKNLIPPISSRTRRRSRCSTTSATTRPRSTSRSQAIDHAGYDQRKAASAAKGKLRGFGISTYIEACGIAPSALVGALGARAGPVRGGQRARPPDRLGDGVHRHALARPGPRDHVRAARRREARRLDRQRRGRARRHRSDPVRHGHLRLALGGGRRLGDRARRSTRSIDKGKKIAAHLLEASAGDIEFDDGKLPRRRHRPRRRRSARSRSPPTCRTTTRSRRSSPGSRSRRSTIRRTSRSRAARHLVEVEIDPETGVVEVVDVAIADDVGVIINPMIVDGQAHGGLAQGIGQALLRGGPSTTTTASSRTARTWTTACRARRTCRCFKVGNHVTACTHNPIGVKGVGEVGAIGVPPAVINAVLDALRAARRHRHLDARDAREGVARDPGRQEGGVT